MAQAMALAKDCTVTDWQTVTVEPHASNPKSLLLDPCSTVDPRQWQHKSKCAVQITFEAGGSGPICRKFLRPQAPQQPTPSKPPPSFRTESPPPPFVFGWLECFGRSLLARWIVQRLGLVFVFKYLSHTLLSL
eukprot:65582-Rhodomonas_salina.4